MHYVKIQNKTIYIRIYNKGLSFRLIVKFMNLIIWIISILKIAEHIICLKVVLVLDGGEYIKKNQLNPILAT